MMHNIVAALLAAAYVVQSARSGSLPDLIVGSKNGVSHLYPGQIAPGSLRIPTLNGQFTFDPDNHSTPLVIMAYDSNNAALRNMWHSDESLHVFLASATPNDTQFLFLSYADSAKKDMLDLAARMGAQLKQLPAELRSLRERQLHFVTAPVPSLRGGGWLPRLLAQWRSQRRILRAETKSGNWQLFTGRLDGRFGFVPSPEGGTGLRISPVHDACALPDPPSPVAAADVVTTVGSEFRISTVLAAALESGRRSPVSQAEAAAGAAAATFAADALAAVAAPGAIDPEINGTAALVVQRGHAAMQGVVQGGLSCSYPALLQKLAYAGAAAAVVGSPPGQDVTEIQCRGKECEQEITLPATMIPNEDAQKIAEAVRWFSKGGTHSNASSGAADHETITASFLSEKVAGNFAGVDAGGRLVELGWQVFPTLKQLAWAAQWLTFQAELQGNLSRPALVVPVFNSQVLPEPGGLRAEINMPSAAKLAGLDTLELDFALSCPGHFDADCPQWDHVVQLHVCCSRDCKPCTPLVWDPPAASPAGSGSADSGGASSGGASSSTASSSSAAGNSNQTVCGAELGRWITPFRRRVGRWLTDVSELRPLLPPGGTCRFTLQAPPWAPGWKPALSLRFSRSRRPGDGAGNLLRLPSQQLLQRQSRGLQRSSRALLGPLALQLSAHRRRLWRRKQQQQQDALPAESAASGADQAGAATGDTTTHESAGSGPVGWRAQQLEPFQVLPLWEGGTFDETYNTGRRAINFTTPAGTRRVLLEAVITGHGYDLVNLQCAEFCVTSHVFSVNGANHSVTYREAGTQWGCADKVPQGSVPNEHGTWMYGRNGWCDGQEVRPWVVDITDDVRLPSSAAKNEASSSSNSISYRGLYEGKDPQPSKTAGSIIMESNLIFLRQADATADG